MYHFVSHCIMIVSLCITMYRAGLMMPDKLTITDRLPVEWLPTSMYIKAALWLYKHNSGKTPYVHKCSGSRYYVLTKAGVDTYGKVTKKLVER